jgi:hypothetical protein
MSLLRTGRSVSVIVSAQRHDILIVASSVCLSRMRYGGDLSEVPPVTAVALLDCSVRRGNSGHGEKVCDLDLLGADFFDDESMVVLYRCRKGDGGLMLFAMHALIVIGPPRTNVYRIIRLQ